MHKIHTNLYVFVFPIKPIGIVSSVANSGRFFQNPGFGLLITKNPGFGFFPIAEIRNLRGLVSRTQNLF